MLVFEDITVKNIPFFKEQSFNLNRKGISLILGQNLNVSSTATNFAGKSLFFSQFGEFLTDEVFVGTKRDITRKGSRSVSFSIGKDKYEAVRSFSPSEKVAISKNGEALNIRELSEAKAKLRSLINFSPEEFKTLVYLDFRTPHPLILGDTAERRKFFLSFFRQLNAMDPVRKLIASQIRALKDKAIILEEVKAQASSLKGECPANIKELKQELEEMSAEHASAEARLAELSTAAALWSRIESYADVSEVCTRENIDTEEQRKYAVSAIKKTCLSLQKAIDDCEAYDKWKSDNQAASEVLQNLTSKLEEIGVKPSKAESYYESCTAVLEDYLKAREKLLDQTAALAGQIREAKEKREVVEAEYDRLIKKRRMLKEAATTCPTCGAPYSNEHASAELEAVRKAIQKNKEIELEDVATLEEELKRLQQASREIQRETQDAQYRAKTLRSYLNLVASNASTSAPPEKPAGKKSDFESDLESYQDKLEALRNAKYLLELEAEWRELPRDIRREAKLGVKEAQQKFTERATAIARISATIESAADKQRKLKELSRRAQDLMQELEDNEPLALLDGAFSKKGLETIIINNLCETLGAIVNRYAKYLFPEDYHFSFELESQFNILVTRKYKDKEEVSDVRKLSGAECRLFSLVLLISLLSFVPKNRRSNVVILDEPTSMMGPDSVQSFVQFLPVLNSVIPHVIVITPLNSTEYAGLNPNVFTVQKKGNRSRILEGQFS
jgi:DNA repair exonuclease SbcCD ATPase subunit